MKNIFATLLLCPMAFFCNHAFAQCNVTISGKTSVCEGDTITLIAHGAASYTWMPQGVISDTLVVSPSSSSVYTVSASSGTCTATTTLAINVNFLPDSNFTITPGIPCTPAWYDFQVSPLPNAVYTWDLGDGTTDTGVFVGHAYYSSGLVAISLTVTTDSGCTATSTQTESVTLQPNPVAAFSVSPQPTSITNPTINFTDQSTGGNSYEWHFGDASNSTSTLMNPSFTYSDTGHYLVQLIVTSTYWCADTVTEYIVISPANGVNTFADNAEVIVSPNPGHDLLTVIVTSGIEELRIVNQLGKEIMSRKSKKVKQEIDLTNLDRGIYFLSVKTQNGVVTRKIIKE